MRRCSIVCSRDGKPATCRSAGLHRPARHRRSGSASDPGKLESGNPHGEDNARRVWRGRSRPRHRRQELDWQEKQRQRFQAVSSLISIFACSSSRGRGHPRHTGLVRSMNGQTDLYNGIFALDYPAHFAPQCLCFFCKVAEDHQTFRLVLPTNGSRKFI